MLWFVSDYLEPLPNFSRLAYITLFDRVVFVLVEIGKIERNMLTAHFVSHLASWLG